MLQQDGILLIDDDPGTIDTFGAILRLDGWRVRTATTGREGLDIADRASLMAALIDVRLPDMTWLDVLQSLRHQRPDIRCILMTGFATVAAAVEAMRLGALDYVEKPLTDAQLLRAVRRTLSPADLFPKASSSNHLPDVHPLQRDWRVVAALEIIQRRYSESALRLGDVAKELDVSTEHLCRLLKRDTASGFRMHLNSTRIRQAQRLLLETSLSIKEIANLTGHKNTTRLDRVFKRITGALPLIYRRQRQQCC